MISDEILKDHPDWSYLSFICRADLADYRIKYVQSLLRSEKGELSNLENEVIGSMQRHELISRNTESDFDQNWTFGEKLADKIASFGGSWAFLICFALFLTGWIVLNTVVMVVRPVDPYPFYFAEFSVVMFSCNSGTYYYDESKPSRSKRPFAFPT